MLIVVIYTFIVNYQIKSEYCTFKTLIILYFVDLQSTVKFIELVTVQLKTCIKLKRLLSFQFSNLSAKILNKVDNKKKLYPIIMNLKTYL